MNARWIWQLAVNDRCFKKNKTNIACSPAVAPSRRAPIPAFNFAFYVNYCSSKVLIRHCQQRLPLSPCTGRMWTRTAPAQQGTLILAPERASAHIRGSGSREQVNRNGLVPQRVEYVLN